MFIAGSRLVVKVSSGIVGVEFRALEASARSRRVPCAKSVPESDVFMPLGLALSEKQIPQITENTEKSK
jgi:hypothetical protein